ncbi:hypothetical protein [Flagellimonas sp. 2504JD4-2]
MRLVFSFTFFLFFILMGCRNHGKTNTEEKPNSHSETQNSWYIDSTAEIAKNEGLLNVESIVYDKSNKVLYASNGKDYKPGVEGFISKISLDGTVANLKWVPNLNRPTGMALKDSILYVADVDALIAINTGSGEIVAKYDQPVKNSGLNDVAINANGEVFVSASFVHSIFRLRNNVLESWVTDSKALQWANGLSADNESVMVGGLSLTTISVDSVKIQSVKTNPIIKDFDGIQPDGQGGYFLTTVEHSGLYHLNSEGVSTKLMDGEAYFGDLEFIPDENRIYIPRGNHKTNDYFIAIVTLGKK